jgi:hypothetical protein
MRDLPGTAQRLANRLDARQPKDERESFAWQRRDGTVVWAEVTGSTITLLTAHRGEEGSQQLDAGSFTLAVAAVEDLQKLDSL